MSHTYAARLPAKAQLFRHDEVCSRCRTSGASASAPSSTSPSSQPWSWPKDLNLSLISLTSSKPASGAVEETSKAHQSSTPSSTWLSGTHQGSSDPSVSVTETAHDTQNDSASKSGYKDHTLRLCFLAGLAFIFSRMMF